MYDPFTKSEMSGSLIFRDAPSSVKLPNGKKMMMVFGVVAVDADFQISGESQVRIRAQGGSDAVHVQLEPQGKPVDPKYLGWTVNDMLEAPLWRV